MKKAVFIDYMGTIVEEQSKYVYEVIQKCFQNSNASGIMQECRCIRQGRIVNWHVGGFSFREEIPIKVYVRHITFYSARQIRMKNILFEISASIIEAIP